MAERTHKTRFDITADDQATRVFKQVEAGLGGVQFAYGRLTAAFAGVTAVVATMGGVSRATIDAERSSLRLDAALRATGHSAGIARDELDELAESIKGSTAFDDDEVRKGLAALIRFREIQGDTFREVARLGPDLAVALDIGLTEAYQRLGRAIQDPLTGMRGLRDAGVKLNEQQVQNARQFQETGDKASAARIVLDELTKSIGGAAAGENSGLYGSSKSAGKAYDDFLKAIGQSSPGLATQMSFWKFLTQTFTDLENIIKRGDWVEKTLALMAFAGGMRGMQLSERPPAPGVLKAGDLVPGARPIGGAVPPNPFEGFKAAAEQPWPGRGAPDDSMKRLLEEGTRGWIAYADAVFEAADAENRALATGPSFTQWAEQQRDAVLDNIDPTRRWAQEIKDLTVLLNTGYLTLQQFNQAAMNPRLRELLNPAKTDFDILNEALKEGDIGLDQYLDTVKRIRGEVDQTKDSAKELGLIFSSAASDAFRDWQGVGNLVRAIGIDIAQLIFRKNVAEPASDFFSKALSGIIGGMFGGSGVGASAAAGASFAKGTDFVPRDGLAMLHRGEAVIPARENRSGGVTIVQHLTFGSDVTRATLVTWAQEIKRQTIAAVAEESLRGGSYRRALTG